MRRRGRRAGKSPVVGVVSNKKRRAMERQRERAKHSRLSSCNGGPRDGRRYQDFTKGNGVCTNIFQPKNNRILSSRFRGRIHTLIGTDQTGNAGWPGASYRLTLPPQPHLAAVSSEPARPPPATGPPPLRGGCRLTVGEEFSCRVHPYTALGVGTKFSPNSTVATMEQLLLDRPLYSLQHKLQLTA